MAVDQGIPALNDRAFDAPPGLLPPGGPIDSCVLDITVARLLHHSGGFDLVVYPLDPFHKMEEIAAAMGVETPPDALTIGRWNAR